LTTSAPPKTFVCVCCGARCALEDAAVADDGGVLFFGPSGAQDTISGLSRTAGGKSKKSAR
jgi:hypothetical protein